MDSSNANSGGTRPDLTIPIPAGFVSAGPSSPAGQQQQQQPPQQVQQPQQVKLNMAATIAAAAAAAAAAAGGGGSTANAATPAATAAENGATAAAASGKKVRYRECLKNHAAGIGGHAMDGCGEFMPSKEGAPVPAACDDAPAPLRCAACGCHRNFHRREVEGEKPPPCEQCRKRQLTSLQGTPQGTQGTPQGSDAATHSGGPLKKRFRTKFSGEQKERMFMLSEKLGWRIQKHDEAEVAQFCADTGVKRHVLKVWMHNNKHTFANKKGLLLPATSSPSSSSQHHHQQQQPQQQQHQQQQHHEPT